MSWTQIIGYVREKKILQRAILEGRVANSYCFIGLEGVGKDAVAIQFAKTLNCEEPVITDDSYDSCDKCKSCRSIKDFSHQNFEYIFALPTSKKADAKGANPIENLSDEQLEEVKNELEKKSKDNYYKMQIENASIIKISSIRHLKKSLTLSGSGRGRRIAIISEADKMNDEASNSFLKTLEEPNSNITIILTTSKPNRILPTILSRCQQINFGPMSNDEIIKALIQRDGFALEDAQLAAAFGQGSYTKALHSADDDILNLREQMLSLLRLSVKKKNYRLEMTEMIDLIIKENDKNKLHTALSLLLFLIRDAILIRENSKIDNLINTDKEEVLNKFVKAYEGAALDKIVYEIERASTSIYKNVNKHLIFLRLLMNIRKLLAVKTR
jgi:DNA polymerase-3 subunit delta'